MIFYKVSMKGKILDLKINYEVWYEKVRFLLLKIGRFFFWTWSRLIFHVLSEAF